MNRDFHVRRIIRVNQFSSSTRPSPRTTAVSGAEEEVEQAVLVPPATHAKNAVMALSLLTFCCAVAWYSMNAVGQAASGDDPLAALREEAAAAQERHEKEEKSTAESAEMLKKFQAGDFDPDKYEEDEAGEQKPKRSWWKFW